MIAVVPITLAVRDRRLGIVITMRVGSYHVDADCVDRALARSRPAEQPPGNLPPPWGRRAPGYVEAAADYQQRYGLELEYSTISWRLWDECVAEEVSPAALRAIYSEMAYP
jgi:hypothetical protein